jgi:hypothetical protein
MPLALFTWVWLSVGFHAFSRGGLRLPSSSLCLRSNWVRCVHHQASLVFWDSVSLTFLPMEGSKANPLFSASQLSGIIATTSSLMYFSWKNLESFFWSHNKLERFFATVLP